MATKNNTRSKKQRNQIIFIAIGGVLFLALAVIQGPKLLKGNSQPATQASTPAATSGSNGSVATSAAAVAPAPELKGSAVVVKPSPRPGAKTVVAGISVSPWQVPQASTGQLWTFSRLKDKDPFVQQIDAGSQITQVPRFANSNSGVPSPTSSSAPRPASTNAAPATVAPTELPPTHATIEVNGNEVRLALDQRFPPSTKVFKLAVLKPKSAEIVLAAGGSIGQNSKIVLTMGKPLTLVNSATGKRYTLRLLYTGSEPEAVQKFSTKK
jgi:hypothetical protein